MGNNGRKWCWLLAACGVLALAGTVRAGYYSTVAQDGSGDFTTVQAAIDAVPRHQPGRTNILIRAGNYHEKITVPKYKPRLTLVGESRATTIITSDDYTAVRGVDVTDTLTCYVEAKDFAARNLTFANTAGDVGQGTFAMWIIGNRAHFRNCAFSGYQDTLYSGGAQAYFKRCFIEGQIDFIWGPYTSVFKDCMIHCLGSGSIVASSTPTSMPYGFVFKGCTIYGEAPAGTVLLARALEPYANVVFSGCSMDAGITPTGWDDAGDPSQDSTVFFAEYDSTGDGADPADRVSWSQQLTADENADYSLNAIFGRPTTTTMTPMLVAQPAKAWYDSF